MQSSRKTLFISDLHLCEEAPHINKIFLDFLANLDSTVDGLYILGDLFEAWIGDDDASAFLSAIKSAIKAVTQKGIPIYLLHGNRDFLIGERFLKETGCTLLADESVMECAHQRVLLMHGDTLCTKDVSYLKARKILRNRTVQTVFLWLPLAWRKRIAKRMREKSQQHTTTSAYDIMDVSPDAVQAVMQKNKIKFLIHGHTHRPGIHPFTLDTITYTRIVLGAWHHHGNMLVWDETGQFTLVDFS